MRDLSSAWAVLADLARRAGLRKVATAVALALASGAAAILTSLWLKLLLDAATRDHDKTVVAAGIAMAVTLAVQVGSFVVSSLLLGDIHLHCGLLLVQDCMRMAGAMPGIEHHERPDFVNRIALLREEMRYLSGSLTVLGEGIGLAGRTGMTVVLLAGVHPALLLLPVLAAPSLWTGKRAEAIVNRAAEATAEAGRREVHLFTLATTAGPAKEVRVFGLGDELVRREQEAWNEVTEAVAAAQLRAGLLRIAGWLASATGYVGAMAFVVVQATRGGATPGDVLLVLTLAGQVSGQVSQAVNLVNRSASAVRVLRRYTWLRDYAATASAPATEPHSPPRVPVRLQDAIRFESVIFSYPDTGTDVLRDVTLELPAGSTVALVGENGAGKTSLVKLLGRYYEPSSGRITVDGVDIASFDVDEWRRRISGAFQDYARLELVLRESVGVGDLGQIRDEVAVGTTLARVGADLPVGLDAQLGRQWPGGVDVSEGQWQKIAVARAMMRDAPLLLILDEPTSGLDAHAEHELFELFARVAAEVAATTSAVALLVSHRFSTVRMADHIVVLDGGAVAEHGSHDELMAAGGLYAELYGIQARAYR